MNVTGLTVVSVERGYIVCEDESGEEVMLTPGPLFRPVVFWEDFDLQSEWLAAVGRHRANGHYYSNPSHGSFDIQVGQTVANLDDVDYVWCENCSEPVKSDESVAVDGGDSHVCETCYQDHYTSCSDCGNIVGYDSTTGTLHDESVCGRCLDNYSFCDDCDGYYHHNYSDQHSHGGCDCESPAQVFTMRNGDAVIAQDERFTIGLPAGVISDEGMYQIAALIRSQQYEVDASTDPDYALRTKWYVFASAVQEMDSHWQTKEGNFTKRLSKLAHKSQGLKIPADVLTKVGNIARAQSNGADLAVEVTRDLNQSAADFYHEDSCWWQSYSESRCSLKSNGGIGLRSFTTYGGVSGRAWIMPLRLDEHDNLQPTFDSMTADAFIVFNGYGDLEGYAPARIVAQMAGMTYRKVNFSNSPMYVNGDSGYLVASEDIAAKYTDSSLRLYTDEHSRLFDRETSAQLTTV